MAADLKCTQLGQFSQEGAPFLPYDPDVFDSMATINSEIWNEESEKELEPITVDTDIVSGDISRGGPTFLKAAQTGNIESVKILLQQFGRDILKCKDEDGYTALHRAAYNGHLEVVEYLIECGADVRSRTEEGWEPLHCACKWNKVTVASLLLQNGAKVNATMEVILDDCR